MSDNHRSAKAKKLLNYAIKERRLRQYNQIKRWDKGIISAEECIENIVELDKLIALDMDSIRRKKDGNKSRK